MSDLISRAELFNRLANVQTLADAYGVIQSMPSAEPRTGKWLPGNNTFEKMYYICSECKRETQIPRYVGGFLYNFCPNCGVDMREEIDQ